MVKADVRRDYYADLGLTPSADAEDVKKQFRKLALKYHPDRNPGRELEFNAKFQAIQAANEILSDPQQRLKYDTDRLRAGYGKLYGPPKANTSRKTPTNPYNPASSAKPQAAKPPFSARPQSFHNGPSSGAQRFASYARAAPKQPWEKTQDDGQTRADAYRGFQDMKGNQTPAWSQFDPRTGRAGYPGAVPRPSATPNAQSARPKSAYEYFKTSPKTAGTDSSRTQSTKKKQGFAPRTAGGDEPMASNTSSYANVSRGERSHTSNHFFESAPSPTAKKAAAAFHNRAENSSTSDFERPSSKYASTGGEKTFFSSAWLARSKSVRNSPEGPKAHSRTNPPSPIPPPSGRHRSASPKLKTDSNRHYDSTSSSDIDEEEFISRKPKAVPKSRLRTHQKYSDFRTQQDFNPGTGHDSDSATLPRGAFGGFASANADNPFYPYRTPKTSGTRQPRSFKSSSHDDLRKPFSVNDWDGAFQEGADFFAPASSEKGRPQSNHGPNGRGRTPARSSHTKPGQAEDPFVQDSSGTASNSHQQSTPFAEAKFHADDWAVKFKDMLWAMPSSDGTQQQANTQRQRSPRKQTRPGVKVRPAPQPASVATEAEESKTTFNGSKRQAADVADGEAMDLDDDSPFPAGNTETVPEPQKATKYQEKEMPPRTSRPPSSAGVKEDSTKSKGQRFNLKNLGSTAPFTNTNSGGIEDLKDIHVSLPFESRAKATRTTMRDIRPRELVCPNPPKRPTPPELVPISAGSQQLGLPVNAWNRYVAEMNAYMREWNAFNSRILRHFNARQEAVETGMAVNWIGAAGDSTRLKINGYNGEDNEADNNDGEDEDESDDAMVAGNPKAGYSAYVRGLQEDDKVRKHWEVACERHWECILKLGQTREWIRNGGKLI